MPCQRSELRGRIADTYRKELVLPIQQLGDSTYAEHTLVLGWVLPFGVQDAGTDDLGQILNVHKVASLFIHMREGGNPFQEDEEYLHTVSVVLWHQATDQVQSFLAFLIVLDVYAYARSAIIASERNEVA